MICNFMIFLEYVGSRACLSAGNAEQAGSDRLCKVCRFFYCSYGRNVDLFAEKPGVAGEAS